MISRHQHVIEISRAETRWKLILGELVNGLSVIEISRAETRWKPPAQGLSRRRRLLK